MAKKKKYYVVWDGWNPGIYTDWEECKEQVLNYPNAKYRGYENEDEAVAAFSAPYQPRAHTPHTPKEPKRVANPAIGKPITDAIAVDAACRGNPGKMEYRGVYIRNGAQIFHVGPFEQGTNNIGEFLALVHGLAYMKKNGFEQPIYSDSANAISWIKQKKCKTKLVQTSKNAPIFDMIARAEKWLAENEYHTQIIKWETKVWGEIPADFGRK